MELTFADKHFRDLCYNESLANHQYGAPLANKLKRSLADIAAVLVASDLFLLPGNPTKLTGDQNGRIAMSLLHEYRLVFQAGHIKPPVLQSGEIDWSRVKRIKILGLERAHE